MMTDEKRKEIRRLMHTTPPSLADLEQLLDDSARLARATEWLKEKSVEARYYQYGCCATDALAEIGAPLPKEGGE